MKRSSSPSFVLTLKLNTSKEDERILMAVSSPGGRSTMSWSGMSGKR